MLKPFHTAGVIEAGCDEAGRGCLAGPVYAAAVILPPGFDHPFLNDSKQLSAAKRQELKTEILESALSWSVASASVEEIDSMNILRASWLAMHRAIEQLNIRPAHLIVDGNRFLPFQGINHHCIVKGDGTFFSIAAASILAKTFRDEFMDELHRELPHYQWDRNKGYPTPAHREGIKKFGASEWHRKSFQLLNTQTELPLG